ncbi:MAG: pilus assembly protein [Cypionkella sp.]|jgi:Flp pilus assembly pilin Flp|nr:pilus assembly protein [Cypionkella sp.]
MKLLNIFKNFKNDESGAVTVDWVVLTAAVVGLGLLVISQLQEPIENAGTSIGLDITNATTENRN